MGRRIASGLAEIGWRVYALTSRPELTSPRVNVEPISCDWTLKGLKAAINRLPSPQLWVHAAANVDFSDEKAIDLYQDNALLTDELALAASETTTSRFIYLSSISVYGIDQKMEISVDPCPSSHYGMSKLIGERICLSRLQERALVLRLAGVWGKEERPKLFINRCLKWAEAGRLITIDGAGTAKRNYLWVGDIPKLIELAYSRKWHGVRLCADRKLISIGEMARAIADSFGVGVEQKQADCSEKDILVEPSANLQTTDFFRALEYEVGNI